MDARCLNPSRRISLVIYVLCKSVFECLIETELPPLHTKLTRIPLHTKLTRIPLFCVQPQNRNEMVEPLAADERVRLRRKHVCRSFV